MNNLSCYQVIDFIDIDGKTINITCEDLYTYFFIPKKNCQCPKCLMKYYKYGVNQECII